MSATKQEVLTVLATRPDGMTSREVIAAMGCASYQAQGILSKLAAYGAIDKVKPPYQCRPSNKVLWRIKRASASVTRNIKDTSSPSDTVS